MVSQEDVERLRELLARPAQNIVIAREAGERVIANELPKIPHEKIRIASEKRLIRIADGERDFRF